MFIKYTNLCSHTAVYSLSIFVVVSKVCSLCPLQLARIFRRSTGVCRTPHCFVKATCQQAQLSDGVSLMTFARGCISWTVFAISCSQPIVCSTSCFRLLSTTAETIATSSCGERQITCVILQIVGIPIAFIYNIWWTCCEIDFGSITVSSCSNDRRATIILQIVVC